jgi:hypothetical protein
MARGLERVARAEGADHALWYFSITPVAVADCVVELLDGNEWRPRMPESAHLDAVQDRGRRE